MAQSIPLSSTAGGLGRNLDLAATQRHDASDALHDLLGTGGLRFVDDLADVLNRKSTTTGELRSREREDVLFWGGPWANPREHR